MLLRNGNSSCFLALETSEPGTGQLKTATEQWHEAWCHAKHLGNLRMLQQLCVCVRVCVCVCVCVLTRACTQSCPTLCDPMDAPLSKEFSSQEYWSRMPFPMPGDLPNPGVEPVSFSSSALAGGFFNYSTTWVASNSCLHLPKVLGKVMNLFGKMVLSVTVQKDPNILALFTF